MKSDVPIEKSFSASPDAANKVLQGNLLYLKEKTRYGNICLLLSKVILPSYLFHNKDH